MSDWPTSRKNDAPRGGEGETGLEAMVSAPRPPDCPRSAPALRGSFFAWEEKGTQARSVDARRRRAITAPSSAQSAARGGLKSAIPPPQSPFRGLFVEFGSSGQRDADGRGRQRFFAAVLLRLAVEGAAWARRFAWARGFAYTAPRPLRAPRRRGAGMLAGCLRIAANAMRILKAPCRSQTAQWPRCGLCGGTCSSPPRRRSDSPNLRELGRRAPRWRACMTRRRCAWARARGRCF